MHATTDKKPMTTDPALAKWSDADAGRALEALRTLPESQHEALVGAWLAGANAAAIAAVAGEESVGKTARKAARRAVGILKARGVALPEKAQIVSALNKVEFTLEARMLYPDGRGVQLWWIARVASNGRTEVAEVTTHDREGLVSLERGNPTHGNLRQVWSSWQGRAGRTPVAVPVEYARARIEQAKRISIARKAILPIGLDAAGALLTRSSTGVVTHPIDAEELALPTDEAAVKARLGESARLHGEPEFSAWLPDDRAGIAFLTAVNEKVAAMPRPQEGDDEATIKGLTEAIDAAVNGLIEEASDAYFDDERKAIYGVRFRDAAFSLASAGKVGAAIDALLVADAIKKSGIVSDRPSEIPFVRAMFVKLLAAAQQQAQRNAQQQAR
jgi:hypothetical protein